jgi:hypothetical protein
LRAHSVALWPCWPFYDLCYSNSKLRTTKEAYKINLQKLQKKLQKNTKKIQKNTKKYLKITKKLQKITQNYKKITNNLKKSTGIRGGSCTPSYCTGWSEFEDGLGSGDFVSGYSYHMSVRTGLPDHTMQTKFQSQLPRYVESCTCSLYLITEVKQQRVSQYLDG